ncbi:MAG: phytoene/squalene synthase family protein, partial [Thermoguttaceae bacterium]
MSRSSGSNFYWSFKLLPQKKRRAMEALYAFMRYTDDLIDAPPLTQSTDTLQTSINQQRELLRAWRGTLQQVFSPHDCRFTAAEFPWAGAPPLGLRQTGTVPFLRPRVAWRPRKSRQSPPNLQSTGLFILPALIDTVHNYSVPVDCLFDVLSGVEMDLNRRRYETFEDLRLYCQRVASAVGLACIHIWGFSAQGTADD